MQRCMKVFSFEFETNMFETSSAAVALWPVLHRCRPMFLNQIGHFSLYGDFGTEIFVITRNGLTFVAGTNGPWPTLPVGHRNPVPPERPEPVRKFGARIIDFRHGQRHAVALTNDGRLFSWGDNRYGQLGTATRFESSTAILVGEQIAAVVCGAHHTVAVTAATGQVFAWGRNNYGQIGVRHNNDQMVPVKISTLDRYNVRAVFAGHSHSLALTDDGRLFAWGANSYGQLGIGNCTHQTIPVPVTGVSGEIRSVAAGESHTLILLANGEIMSCGRNHRHQLGTKQVPSSEGSCVPVRIRFMAGPPPRNRFQTIGSHWGTDFSMATGGSSGYCFVWGDCRRTETTTGEGVTFPSPELLPDQCSPIQEPRQTPLIRQSDCFALYCSRRVTPGLVAVDDHSIDTPATTGNRIIDRLAKLFDDPETGDVRLMADGRSIYAHRWFLQLANQYLARLLADEWTNGDNNEKPLCITINQYSYPVLYGYIRFLYTGRLAMPVEVGSKPNDPDEDEEENETETNDDVWAELLDLSHCYLDDELQRRCLSVMYDRMSVENCCHHYQLAQRYQILELESAVADFVRQHLIKVIRTESFRCMPDDQCKTLMMAVAAIFTENED